jgi:YVTN family beta-propeller protein
MRLATRLDRADGSSRQGARSMDRIRDIQTNRPMDRQLRSPRRLALAAAALVSLTAGDVAASSGTLVVLNKAEASASLIDLASGKVAATVKTGDGPHEVAISPDGKQAVVTNYGGQGKPGSTLTVIDLAGARVARTIDLGSHRRPHGIQFAPGGRDLLVTAEDSRALLVLDPASGKVRKAIITGQEVSHMVAASPDGKRAYVASIGSGTMTAIDLAAGKVLGHVATGAGAEGIAVTPDGASVWVTNRDADNVAVVDARTLNVIARVPAPSFPIRVQITADGKVAVVSCAKSGEVRFFDVGKRTELAKLGMQGSAASGEGKLFGDQFGKSPVPIGIVIPPAGDGRAYVASAHADEVVAIDLKGRKIVTRLRAGKEPDGLGWSPVTVTAKSR